MCDHGHSHNHGGCGSEAQTFDYGNENQQYTMCTFIDKDKVNVLNEEIEGTGVDVFKVWNQRMDKTKSVTSDVDQELLFNIPFHWPYGEMHPGRLRIFKDRENMSFEDVTQGKPDQEMELKQDTEAKVDYPLASSKFSNVHCLTLYFPTNFGDDQTRIYYIGLRGSYQHDYRERIAIANYEARPVPDDHKVYGKDQVQRHVF
ncbi:PITH domain-containing protein [Aphelenchoides bicaudatus]|nr:PITH domain-containing protein [Aphelenchoides bicaudatus]